MSDWEEKLVMGQERQLKPGWQRVKFGDVVRQAKDKVNPNIARLDRYIAGEHMDTDDLKIRRWGEIGADYLGPAFHMRFKPGQVLYGSRRTYLRKVAVPDFEGICANTTFVLESKNPNVLMPELLPFIMQTERFNEHSVKQSKGSVNPYVNFSDLAWFELALPPLEEQKFLVEKLQAIEKSIESFLEAHKKAEELRKSYLEKIFYLNPKKSRKLNEVAQIVSGGTPNKSRQDFWNGVIPWLSPKDMKAPILFNTESHISQTGLTAGSKLAPANSIFIVVRGMILAHTFPVCRSQVPMAFNQDIKAIIVSPEYNPAYVHAWFDWAAPRYLQLVSESSHGTKRLEMGQLLRLKIPDVSLDIQDEILKPLCEIDKARTAIPHRLASLGSIKRNILLSIGGAA